MNLQEIRANINKIDEEIIALLAKRQRFAVLVGKFKKKNGVAINQPKREKELFSRLEQTAEKKRVSVGLVKKTFKLIISDSKVIQKKILEQKK